ncbi:class I adenylate-forming enzyme family protein [Amycolatopsis anabasis]|uniref:class I adenylate-forming enzyme family protein n=1 Tax=Amycolatopsis anabasis TaxID=1840409 RepID=UPI00131DABC0|nr:class I adenylate-forming enzyme family protein [Amycolatopsis anabasis]
MTLDSWWGAELLRGGADDAVWARAASPVTNGSLRAEVTRLAALFRGQGIGPGCTVAVQGTPSFTQLWSIFALWSLGAQVLLLDPRLRGNDRAALLAQCSPQVQLVLGGAPRSPEVFIEECETLVRRLPGGRPARTGHCLVQFSSGTTGRIKAIGRTPESLLGELNRLAAIPGMPGRGEQVLLLDSTTHSFGLIGGVLHALNAGATTVFATGPLGAAARDVQVILGNPRHFETLAATPDALTLPRLRLAVSCGEILPQRVYDEFAERFGVLIGQAYGTTETGIVATDLGGRFGPRSIGLPAPGIRTRVTEGVLHVHVPQSPYLYEHHPWVGGWLSTQDLVTWNPEQRALRLRGRVDAEGVAGCTDVDLLEIETVLRAHRLVSNAVVLGDPVEAHVVGAAELDEAELREWCHWFLPDGNTPSRYHLMRELPLTPNGKALRSRSGLREHRLAVESR